MNKSELVFFMLFSKVKNMSLEKKNKIIYFLYNYNYTLERFFYEEKVWNETFKFSDKEKKELRTLKEKIPNFTFIIEKIESDGYTIIPNISTSYPKKIRNLPLKIQPILIYLKGNLELLNSKLYYIYGNGKKHDYIVNNAGKNILISETFCNQQQEVLFVDLNTFEMSKNAYKLYANNNLLIINSNFPCYSIADYIFLLDTPNKHFILSKNTKIFFDKDLKLHKKNFIPVEITQDKIKIAT